MKNPFHSKALPSRQELREFVALANFDAVREAVRFSRNYGSSLWAYPGARRANLSMLPRWVDPRRGLVLDIGANEGAWTGEVVRLFPGTRVLAFEPGEEPADILTTRFANVPNVTVDRRAVGAGPGVQTYYRTRASVFASLLPPAPVLHELYELPGDPTEVLETVDVATVALDDIVDEPVSVVKLDVQGGERAVIEGGQRVLRGADAVLIEVVFQPHYEGDASFDDLNRLLMELGFVLHDFTRPFRLHGSALWADACYVRNSSSALMAGDRRESVPV